MEVPGSGRGGSDGFHGRGTEALGLSRWICSVKGYTGLAKVSKEGLLLTNAARHSKGYLPFAIGNVQAFRGSVRMTRVVHI